MVRRTRYQFGHTVRLFFPFCGSNYNISGHILKIREVNLSLWFSCIRKNDGVCRRRLVPVFEFMIFRKNRTASQQWTHRVIKAFVISDQMVAHWTDIWSTCRSYYMFNTSICGEALQISWIFVWLGPLILWHCLIS